MLHIDHTGITLKLKHEGKTPYVFDPVRKGWFVLTPEEHVRQYLIQYLLQRMNYPQGMIAVEKQISVGGMSKRFDVVIYDREHKPWMLIECKAPEVPISEATLQQLLNYQRSIQGKYWLLSNGHQSFCADAGDVQHIQWLDALPAYGL